ncbi:Inner-membrane translocator [Desulfamplus magnetovallimortis]|uniref:Inner-membrane translocator n=1 Tax=Desulfamplus magnetovallimortis TaxID=1246637 RepID=A0A1W1HJ92_9BACT|nr:branched-chain amino acid ABC transporter permease [Desulfamplus magnetovallimortis]SLM32442.1 Inner-membrane translocator [Desulfamplus magnetovallimortis]
MFVEIIDVIISGMINGSVYALMAVGLTLIYGVSKAFNFAYGSFYSMGGYLAWMIFSVAVINSYFIIFILSIPVLLVLGYLIEKVLVAPLRKRDDWEIKVMMITLGLALLLDNSYQVLFGARMKSLPSILEGSLEIGEFILAYQDIVIFILSIGGILLFRWFLNNTRTGMSVRAVAQNPAGAQIVGIPKEFVFSATFAISTVMVGTGGILLAQKYFVTPTGGWDILVKAWVITAFGGMGSIKGSLYAAFILGMLEAFVGWYFGMTWVLIALFAVLLTTLAIRPQGLMGKWG